MCAKGHCLPWGDGGAEVHHCLRIKVGTERIRLKLRVDVVVLDAIYNVGPNFRGAFTVGPAPGNDIDAG